MWSLIVPILLFAQTKPTSWGGVLMRPTGERTPATMELTLSGGGAISGRITGPKLSPATFTGTHEPSSGAVKFTARIEGGQSNDAFDFTGSIRHDTLEAVTSLNGDRATLRVVKGAKAPEIELARGPQNPSDPARAAVQRTFIEVSGWIARAAAAVPPDKYSYRPTQSIRTFAELVGHVADGYTYYCTRAGGKEIEWSDAIEKGPKDKAAIAAKLKTAQDLCSAAQTRGQLGALVDNVAHSNLHYGNIITYMRMMGLTPPSS